MSSSTMKILYGPPGTGKTWQATRDAVKAIEPTAYEAAMLEADPDLAIRTLHKNLVTDGRILWVTFHPSYSYEDFIEGYRPVVDDLGQLGYRVVDGPFKTICLRAKYQDDIQIGEQLIDGAGRPAGVVVDKDSGGWIVRITPNRSDEVAATIDKYVPRYVVERVLEKGFSPKIFSIPGKSIFELDEYGIDANDPDVPLPAENETSSRRTGSTIRKIIAARTGMFSSSDLSNASHIGSVVRRLIQLRASSRTEGSPVAIVIDEINRAEPSRVFGELLTLLEVDKRQGMPEEKRIWLPYSKVQFTIPAQVSVIGTMNTVDRSLTTLDFAMRRRFEFIYVGPDITLVPSMYGNVPLQNLLNRINARINMLLGKGYEFGHAFLMISKLEEIKVSHQWGQAADGELRVLAYVLRTSILPTLGEYFHGDWTKIRAIIGEVKIAGETASLFERVVTDEAFMRRLPEEYELSDMPAENFGHWWNPEDFNWDSDRFGRFMGALALGH